MTANATNPSRVRIEPGQSKHSIRVVDIPLAQCRVNPNQPRQYFDEASLQELATSIENHGLLQPITVMRDKRNKDGYVIVAGERRFRAYELLKRETIPAVITTGNPEEIALIENLQRENLSPLEEAEALEGLRQKYGYTQAEIGQAIGKSYVTVSALLKLNKLPKSIKRELPTSAIANRSLLIEIATIKDKKEQLELWKEAKTKGLTVRDIRARRLQTREVKQISDKKRILSTAKRFISELRSLTEKGHRLNPQEYEELLEVFGQFTELLEQVAQQESGN